MSESEWCFLLERLILLVFLFVFYWLKLCIYCISSDIVYATLAIVDNRERMIPDLVVVFIYVCRKFNYWGKKVLLRSLRLAHFYKLLMHKIKASSVFTHSSIVALL